MFALWSLQVMNSSKTDVNIFFSSRNVLQLEVLLDEDDVGEVCVLTYLKRG
jgi:hypothetical protein